MRMIRWLRIYTAYLSLVPKLFMAYRAWVWANLFLNALAMLILYYFWKAVYENQTTLSSLDFQQTINYMMLAQFFSGSIFPSSTYFLGRAIRQGNIINELLRPVDLQWSFYMQSIADVVMDISVRLPLIGLAVVAFGLQLPGNPLAWLCFLITICLGFTAYYMFDWMFGCLTFYTTEVWGISVMRHGLNLFFSGALIPLVMLPDGMATWVQRLPFAQLLYVPLSLLSGITPLSEAPSLWLIQVGWIVVLGVLSRWVYAVALRRVTVHGG